MKIHFGHVSGATSLPFKAIGLAGSVFGLISSRPVTGLVPWRGSTDNVVGSEMPLEDLRSPY